MRKAAVIAACLLLAGCGFHPMYGSALAPQMSSIYVEPIAERDGYDCSGGCMKFYALQHRDGEWLGYDWGVCANPKSHRCGLLTNEHQGCAHFTRSRD